MAKRRLWDVCLMAMLGVVMLASKEALAFLPNIELVSLFTILFTLVFRQRVLGALGVFLLLEGLLYGFGSWWVMYLYIWPLLALLTWLFRWMKRGWQWAILAGLYGLAFGTLCSLVYLPVGGPSMALAWVQKDPHRANPTVLSIKAFSFPPAGVSTPAPGAYYRWRSGWRRAVVGWCVPRSRT